MRVDVLSGLVFARIGKRSIHCILLVSRTTDVELSVSRFWGEFLMRLKSMVAVMAAFLLCCATTGCHLGGGGGGCDAGGCASGGCGSYGGGCTSGSCGGLAGMLGSCFGGGGNPSDCVTPETLGGDGYGTRGGVAGPLAGMVGQHHRGPQSHMGGMPGPADGPPVAQVTYPYYTTRGPRDYFAADPPSIGP